MPLLFQSVYGWSTGISTGISSLAFVGMIVALSIALLLAPVQDKLYNDSAKSHNGTPRPEARLFASMLGSLLGAIGLFVFGCRKPTIACLTYLM